MRLAQRFSTFLTALLILTLMACAEYKRTGPGEVIDDSVITAKVKSALIADSELKATQINVETYRGTVQLSGFVSSADHIPRALRLARDVGGVKEVKNALAVRQ